MIERPKTPKKKSPERPASPTIPGPIFEAWIRGNLTHPQADYGIAALVGKELFSGSYDLSKFNYARLTRPQILKIKNTMITAHAARGISHEKRFEDRLHSSWRGIEKYMIILAYNYVNALFRFSLYPLRSYEVGPEAIHEIKRALEKHPQLKKELVRVFELMQEALDTEEIRALEKQRRELLDYKTHGPRVVEWKEPMSEEDVRRYRMHQKERGLEEQIRYKVNAYIAARAGRKGLSVREAALKNALDSIGR